MKKNVASQAIGAQMVSATDGSAFTGSVTVYVTGDAGTQAVGSVGSGACTHEGNGYHTYAPSQAETNYNLIAFTFIGTGAVPATVQVYTNFPQTVDNATNISAIKTKTDSLTFTAAGYVDANTLKVGGTTQTARDLGASVLLSNGTGTGQVSLSSGTVTVGTNNDKTGYGLSSAAVQAIWDALTSALTTVGSIGKRLVDYLTGDIYARLGAPAGASVSADIAAVKSDSAAILVDTADMQPKLGTPATDISADIATVKSDTGSILTDTAEIGTAGAGLTDLGGMSTTMKAQVNAEVVDTLATDTYAESSAVPSATATLAAKIRWLATLARNKITQTSTTQLVKADDGTTTVGTSTISDDGTTATRGEFV